MRYDMYCVACDDTFEWECPVKEYDEKIKELKCDKCGGKIAQDFSNRKTITVFTYGPGYFLKHKDAPMGSKKRLDAELRENDYWLEGKDPGQKKKAEELKRCEDSLSLSE